jgi:hypothetical protein
MRCAGVCFLSMPLVSFRSDLQWDATVEKEFDRTGIMIAGATAFALVILLWPLLGEWAATQLWQMVFHHAPEGWAKFLLVDYGQIFWALFIGAGCGVGVFQEQEKWLNYQPEMHLQTGERWKIAWKGAMTAASTWCKYAVLLSVVLAVLIFYLAQTGQLSNHHWNSAGPFVVVAAFVAFISIGAGIVGFFYYASMALAITIEDELRYRSPHYRRFGLWPSNRYWFDTDVREYRHVIGGGLGPFFVSPDNHVLEPMSRAKRQEVEIKKRRQRRTVLAQFALWIMIPVGIGWYLLAAEDVQRRGILHWWPVQKLNQYLINLTGIETEWLGLIVGFVGLLWIAGFILEQMGKQSGNVLKALLLEVLYLLGFQFIEGAKVLDPKPGEFRIESSSASSSRPSSSKIATPKQENLNPRPMRGRQSSDEDTLG